VKVAGGKEDVEASDEETEGGAAMGKSGRRGSVQRKRRSV
jgi:hypothetical protein